MANEVSTARARIPQAPVRLTPLAAALGLAFGIAPAAFAATFTVTNTNDSGVGSLRQAVIDANTAAGADTIVFQAGVAGTVTLTTGQIPVTDSVTITGPGAPSMTLTKSGGAARIFDINGGAPTVTISGLTFTGAGGAGIKGGAIRQIGGTLNVQNSVFTNNTAASGGGALYTESGTLNISDSVFTGNSVGAPNDGNFDGGALYIGSGNVTIQNTTISGNFCGNDGGGIYQSNGSLTIIGSTLSNNQAQYGSAISRFNGGTTSIVNSTITGNSTFPGFSSLYQGGAIFLYGGTTTITNSTIANNSAPNAVGGNIVLYSDGTTTLNLVSTIVSGGTDRTGARDLFIYNSGTFNADHSLVQNPGGFLNGTVTATITGQNPLLAPLANNGGPTQTMALQAGSPAIDAGSNPSALAFDQRGAGFPRTLGAQTDIGALEGPGVAPPPPGNTPVPTLSQWGLALLSLLTGAIAMITGRGRRRRRP